LWVIDLGVGLIFFIFILHYSNFNQQKVNLEKSTRELLTFSLVLIWSVTGFFFLALPSDSTFRVGFAKSWFFFISWYDYYDFFFSPTVTDLNLLREVYFFHNS